MQGDVCHPNIVFRINSQTVRHVKSVFVINIMFKVVNCSNNLRSVPVFPPVFEDVSAFPFEADDCRHCDGSGTPCEEPVLSIEEATKARTMGDSITEAVVPDFLANNS